MSQSRTIRPIPARLIEPTDPDERERLLAEAERSPGILHAEVEPWLRDLAQGIRRPPPHRS
jgi:hypothetical protein